MAAPRHAPAPGGAPAAPDPAWVRAVLAGLLATGAALRLAGLGVHSIWFDEATTLYHAEGPDPFRTLLGDRHMPLLFLAYRAWIPLAGTGDAALRLLPALASIASLPLLAGLARRWLAQLGPGRWLLAVALQATAPFLVWIGQEARFYAFVELLTLVVLWGVELYVRGRRRAVGWLVVALGTALLFGVHYLGSLACCTVAALGLAARARGQLTTRALLVLGGAPTVGIAVWTPWLVRALPEQMSSPWGFQARLAPRELLELPARHVLTHAGELEGVWVPVAWAVAGLVTLGLTLFVVRVARRPNPGELAALLTFAAPIAGAFALMLVLPPNFTPRYLTTAAPGTILCAAGGLAALRRAGRRRACGAALVAGCLAISGVQKRENLREDYRSACAELAAAFRPGDAVAAVSGLPEGFSQSPLRHYLRERPRILGSIVDIGAVAAGEAELPPRGTRLHVIYRDADYARPLLQTLEARHRVLERGERRHRVQHLVLELR